MAQADSSRVNHLGAAIGEDESGKVTSVGENGHCVTFTILNLDADRG
jgi:hypothetical protein